MSNEILKEYVSYVLQEGFFLNNKAEENPKSQGKGFLSRLKSLFFSDAAEDIANEWLEDQSTYYDVELDDIISQEVRDFAKRKYKKALARSRGSKEKAGILLMKALDIRFQKKIKQLESEYAKELSDEEDL